jgi:hypothetical protein
MRGRAGVVYLSESQPESVIVERRLSYLSSFQGPPQTPKPDPGFDEKCADICALYRAAPCVAEQGGQTVSIDEMTGIQALERAARSLPMTSGHVERREFEYIRHGTKALIAAFDVAAGTVRGTIGDTRTEEDFVAFMKDLFASAPPATVARRLRQPQYPYVRRHHLPRGRALWHQGRPRRERKIRHPSVNGHTRGILAGSEPSHHLPFHAKARVLDQPDRNLVLNPGQKAPPAR